MSQILGTFMAAGADGSIAFLRIRGKPWKLIADSGKFRICLNKKERTLRFTRRLENDNEHFRAMRDFLLILDANQGEIRKQPWTGAFRLLLTDAMEHLRTQLLSQVMCQLLPLLLEPELEKIAKIIRKESGQTLISLSEKSDPKLGKFIDWLGFLNRLTSQKFERPPRYRPKPKSP